MNYSMVLYILGYILQFESAFLMLPALVSLIYQEEAGIPFVITAAICLVLGLFSHIKNRLPRPCIQGRGLLLSP